MKDSALIGWWLCVIVALIIIGPLLTLWALNTLFPSLAIPYGIDTWAAVAILHGVFRTKITRK